MDHVPARRDENVETLTRFSLTICLKTRFNLVVDERHCSLVANKAPAPGLAPMVLVSRRSPPQILTRKDLLCRLFSDSPLNARRGTMAGHLHIVVSCHYCQLRCRMLRRDDLPRGPDIHFPPIFKISCFLLSPLWLLISFHFLSTSFLERHGDLNGITALRLAFIVLFFATSLLLCWHKTITFVLAILLFYFFHSVLCVESLSHKQSSLHKPRRVL